MEFHHFGLAVYAFEPALSFYKRLGYQSTKPLTDAIQQVELIMCSSELQPDVELIKPVDESSPVYPFLNKNQEMIYHTCYRVDTIKETFNTYFSGMRVLPISAPKPAPLFDNCLVAFYFVKGIGLVELLEKPH